MPVTLVVVVLVVVVAVRVYSWWDDRRLRPVSPPVDELPFGREVAICAVTEQVWELKALPAMLEADAPEAQIELGVAVFALEIGSGSLADVRGGKELACSASHAAENLGERFGLADDDVAQLVRVISERAAERRRGLPGAD